MAWSRRFELFAKPLFDIIRPVPALAWIPLMILWLGIGYASKVGIIFFAAFISATVNSYTGIRRTSQVHLWVGKTFGATNRQLLFKVAIPTALPMIFTGWYADHWICRTAFKYRSGKTAETFCKEGKTA